MAISQTVTLDDESFQRGLADTVRGLESRLVPNRQIAIQLQSWTRENFEASGANQRPRWPALAESTLKQKLRLGYSPKPLIRTGNLRQSFLEFSDNDVAGVGARASFGVDYAEFHQRGTSRMPARPMLPPNDVALTYATRVYERFIATETARMRPVGAA